jgi:hypothetical protein
VIPQRYLDAVAGRDPIELASKAPKRLKKLLDGSSANELEWRPAAGKWSIKEVLAPADGEVDRLAPPARRRDGPADDRRLRQTRSWRLGTEQRTAECLDDSALRAINVALLSRLPKAFARLGLHSERRGVTQPHGLPVRRARPRARAPDRGALVALATQARRASRGPEEARAQERREADARRPTQGIKTAKAARARQGRRRGGSGRSGHGAGARGGGGPETALVLSATGYVGRAVVERLCTGGIRTLAHVRRSPRLRRGARASPGRAPKSSPPVDTAAFAELVRAARDARVPLPRDDVPPVAVRRALASASYGRSPGLSALVIDGAHRAASGRASCCSRPPAPVRARSRYPGARPPRRHLKSSGLEWIARPGYVTGPGRDDFRPLERVGAVVTDGALLWLAVLGMQMLRERYRSIGAPELAKALVSHAFDPQSAGRILPGERLRDFP